MFDAYYKQHVVSLFNDKRYEELGKYIDDKRQFILSELRRVDDLPQIRQLTKHLETIETSKLLLGFKVGQSIEYLPEMDRGLGGWLGAAQCRGNIIKSLWCMYGLHFVASDSGASPYAMSTTYEVWPKEIKNEKD